MELLALWCLLLTLPTSLFGVATANQDPIFRATALDVSERLLKIEEVLETVLKKNLELEARIEVLEDENRQLKDSVKVLEQEKDHGRKQEVALAQEETGSPLASSSVREAQSKRRSVKIPRIVLSGDSTVAFTARVESVNIDHLGKGQTVVYNHVITNVGGAYHNASGIFFAPVSGVYVFNFNTMLEPGDSEYLELAKNGHAIQSSYTHGTGESRYISSCMLVTLQVSQGDEVWVRTIQRDWHGAGIIHGTGLSTFSGWLLAYTD